jgi:hypothetical protein
LCSVYVYSNFLTYCVHTSSWFPALFCLRPTAQVFIVVCCYRVSFEWSTSNKNIRK